MGNSNSMENYPVPVVAPNKFVLKLINNCRCQGCERKLMKLVQKIQGVHSTSIDTNTWQVTISGTVDPQGVIWVLNRKNIKAELLLEEIPSMKKNHDLMQMKTLPVLPVDDQENLVAKVLQIADNEGGLKELEITFKATFNGKNKDGMSLTSDTYKKIDVDDDDHDRGPKSQGHLHNSYYSHYENASGGPPLKPETPWQGNYFPPPEPVAGYEPSAPPWSCGFP
ncbi:hypothetical protein Vadar_001023 [Vaccinium darrowii]|uniref:Uncharacterized protein n=1 Tax=Vaccinium darrowii TaxID=229202 RepID=A0ACB7WWX2_9ERIC|nr:hypothetical protein Vadar_001023 [Vaccinium darrowii]